MLDKCSIDVKNWELAMKRILDKIQFLFIPMNFQNFWIVFPRNFEIQSIFKCGTHAPNAIIFVNNHMNIINYAKYKISASCSWLFTTIVHLYKIKSFFFQYAMRKTKWDLIWWIHLIIHWRTDQFENLMRQRNSYHGNLDWIRRTMETGQKIKVLLKYNRKRKIIKK